MLLVTGYTLESLIGSNGDTGLSDDPSLDIARLLFRGFSTFAGVTPT
jgi:hypothetical protein